MLGDTEGYQ